MKYGTAVRHLRQVAEACGDVTSPTTRELFGIYQPLMSEAWVFGPMLEGVAELEATDLAFV